MREQKIKEYLSAIYVLSMNGQVRGAYLAREMHLTRPTVCVAVSALSEAGYITVDEKHLIHLTVRGEQIAKDSINETVRRGKDFQRIAIQMQDPGTLPESAEDSAAERTLRGLNQNRASEVLESLLILSSRFYCVRVIDISQFLRCSSSSVRAKLSWMEQEDLVRPEAEGTVTLTERGRELAERLYQQHETARNQLSAQGMDPFDADRAILLRTL